MGTIAFNAWLLTKEACHENDMPCSNFRQNTLGAVGLYRRAGTGTGGHTQRTMVAKRQERRDYCIAALLRN